MTQFHFQLKGLWSGGRMGQGKITTEGFQTAVSMPKDMDGPGIGANPEELLMASAANCYMITLASILEKRDWGIEHFDITTEASVSREGGRLKFEKITHKPRIVLKDADEETVKLIEACTHRAEKACFISQTLRGNVEVAVEPVVQVDHTL